jgi:hypothetical protein
MLDKPIRKFVLWKCKNLKLLEKKLELLRQRKQEIIDESSSGLDGQPKAKYKFGDVVGDKVLRMEQVDYAIAKIEYELKTIREFQNSLVGYEREVYDETIAKDSICKVKADFLHVDEKKLRTDRGKLLRQVAERLGEYIDENY